MGFGADLSRDAESRMVAARISSTPMFAVVNTRVLFDASDPVQISISRRNHDIGPTISDY